MWGVPLTASFTRCFDSVVYSHLWDKTWPKTHEVKIFELTEFYRNNEDHKTHLYLQSQVHTFVICIVTSGPCSAGSHHWFNALGSPPWKSHNFWKRIQYFYFVLRSYILCSDPVWSVGSTVNYSNSTREQSVPMMNLEKKWMEYMQIQVPVLTDMHTI